MSNASSPYAEQHTLTMSKLSKNSLQGKVIGTNFDLLLTSINTRALKIQGWQLVQISGAHHEDLWTDPSGMRHAYRMTLGLDYANEGGRKPEPHEFMAICRRIATRAGQPNAGKWSVTEVDGKAYDTDKETSTEAVNNEHVGYAPLNIPADWDSYFDHLYGLDAPIMLVRRAIEAGQDSGWTNRFHKALVGPPGCGKSDICASIKRALGEEAVMEFDATATTAAGAIKELSEREILPQVLVVEEIEKAEEKSMSWLLALLDKRGEIRKTTARNTIQRDTKLLCIATVNDVNLFRKLQAGALASRFGKPIQFKRPSREVLARILNREVDKMQGNRKWVKATLDYCEQNDITDPREVIDICLCGRDMLLTGVYQKMLTETSPENGEDDYWEEEA